MYLTSTATACFKALLLFWDISPPKTPFEDMYKLRAYKRQFMVNSSHWPAVTSQVRSSILKQQQQQQQQQQQKMPYLFSLL